MSEAPAFRYVSCVDGKLVTRYGAGTYIGATLDPKGIASFDPNEVVAISLSEWSTYVREYGRLVRAGDLIERSKAEHEAWQQAQAKASQAAADAAAVAAKAEADKEATAAKAALGEAEEKRKQAVAKAAKPAKEN